MNDRPFIPFIRPLSALSARIAQHPPTSPSLSFLPACMPKTIDTTDFNQKPERTRVYQKPTCVRRILVRMRRPPPPANRALLLLLLLLLFPSDGPTDRTPRSRWVAVNRSLQVLLLSTGRPGERRGEERHRPIARSRRGHAQCSESNNDSYNIHTDKRKAKPTMQKSTGQSSRAPREQRGTKLPLCLPSSSQGKNENFPTTHTIKQADAYIHITTNHTDKKKRRP